MRCWVICSLGCDPSGKRSTSFAAAHVTNRVRAHDDAGDQTAGANYALAATAELQQAAALLDGVYDRVDAAMAASGRIAWHPAPTAPGPMSRWVSVVFLQGQDADEVLTIIDRDGTDAAIEHLAGFDMGEETTQAAFVNGYVYNTIPTGPPRPHHHHRRLHPDMQP